MFALRRLDLLCLGLYDGLNSWLATGMTQELSNNICLGRFYPKDGVPGVLSLSISDEDEIRAYRKIVAAKPLEEVSFFRLTSVPEEAREWLLVGDVICRYDSLDEPMMDLIRINATSTYIWDDGWDAADEEELERVRAIAIEGHTWSFSRTDTQLTMVDPHGRAAVLVVKPKRLTRLFKSFASIVPRTDHEKDCHGRLSLEVKRSGEFVMRAFHAEMLKQGSKVNGKTYTKLRKAAQALYDQRARSAHLPPDKEELRVHFSSWAEHRQRARKFMAICKAVYDEDPTMLPRPLRLMASKHYHIKWVRLTPREWEECLIFWLEYYDGNWDEPIGLSEIGDAKGYKRWAYKN